MTDRLDHHESAQALAVEAEAKLRQGDVREARALYAASAAHEERVLRGIPHDRVRTIGIYGVSLVSLLYKAAKYDEAERWVFVLLSGDRLPGRSEAMLRELLDVINDERALLASTGRSYAPTTLIWSLRGGTIGSGSAPLGAALHYTASAARYVYRWSEYKAGLPLRTKGGPDQAVLDRLQARVTQPAEGSYRFEVRFTEPEQGDLFQHTKATAAELADSAFRFLCALDPSRTSELVELVPQKDYRTALLRLVRNILPSGKGVGEVQVFRTTPEGVESALLRPKLRTVVSSEIRNARPARVASREHGELRGVLRGLHLDKNWLDLLPDDGVAVRCKTPPDMLDDVVGPMVNRAVMVQGYWHEVRGKRAFHVLEVEPLDGF